MYLSNRVDFLLDKVKTAYGLIQGILMLVILSGLVSTASAFENSQLQWTEGISGKIQRDESLAYMGYSVKAVVFPSPVESNKYKAVPEESVETYVGLEISKTGVFHETVLLTPSESYIVPDEEIKVTVKQLPSGYSKEWLFESYNPWVVVEIESRGIPNLEISVHTDKDDYAPSSEIPVTLTLRNTGTADAVNVDIEILTPLPVKRGQLKYHYNRIEIGDSFTEELTFMSPMVKEHETFQIVADVSGYDVKDIQYSAKIQKNVMILVVSPKCLSIRKSTPGKIYLKDMAMVSISVKNSGDCDLKNVTITDSVPDSIRLVGNHTLSWVTDIPANDEWNYRYLIKSTEPDRNGIEMPPATAKYRFRGEDYTVYSNQPGLVVYGPKIILSKMVDVSEVTGGSNVKVTVTAENSGNTPTKVTVFDNISLNTTLISEVESYENSIDSGNKIKLGYTYKISGCAESTNDFAAYEDFLESSKSYCNELVNGIAAYDDFLEANSRISFSYTLRINSNESFKLPDVTTEYYELGNTGDKIYSNIQGPYITILQSEDKKVEETHAETPAPLPSEMPLYSPDLNESHDNITHNVSGDGKFNTFFLSYLWDSSNASFFNVPFNEIKQNHT